MKNSPEVNMNGVFAAVFYTGTSIAIVIFNKLVLSTYHFRCLGILVLSQMLFTCFFTFSIRLLGLVDFPSFNFANVRKLGMMSFLFAAKAGTDLAALKFVNIAMFSVLKRMATPMVLVYDYFLRGKTTPSRVQRAVFILVGGTIMAGASDITFDLVGYLYALLSCVVTAGHTVYIAKNNVEQQINSWGLLFYCSIMSIPFLIVFVVLNGEVQDLLNYPQLDNTGFQVCFLMSTMLGFLIHYAIYMCTTVNSPLTTSVLGQVKAVIQIAMGFIFFAVQPRPLNITGMVISSSGSFYYAYLKFMQSRAGPPKVLQTISVPALQPPTPKQHTSTNPNSA